MSRVARVGWMARVVVAPAIAVALIVTSASGCASAVPSFAGAETTPAGRVDTLVGATARIVATDPPVPSGERERAIAADGVAPAGALRIGVDRNWDVGVVIAGTSGRAELRYGTRLTSSSRLHVGLGAYGGYVASEVDATISGGRTGLLVPLVVGYELGSLAEVWAGARAGAELSVVGGQAAWIGRVGGLVGLALGLRRVHVLAELAVDAELGDLGPMLVLTPAAAVRVRF